ncbi:MAG: transcriptional regulator [Bacteroidetes bacterium]|nr:MAG: transcriptional regulator [Bacteroidota bacterium]
MTKIKESSTWNSNKTASALKCPITYVMNKIGGHWKPIILYYLIPGPKRYSELRRAIPGITEKMLAQHLKQLREDNLIERVVQQEMPPITIYSLSKSGKKMAPILLALGDWALKDSKLYVNLVMNSVPDAQPKAKSKEGNNSPPRSSRKRKVVGQKL